MVKGFYRNLKKVWRCRKNFGGVEEILEVQEERPGYSLWVAHIMYVLLMSNDATNPMAISTKLGPLHHVSTDGSDRNIIHHVRHQI